MTTVDTKMKSCFICGMQIPFNSLRKKYCSKECAMKGKKIKGGEYHKEMIELNRELGRCTDCGEEIDSLKYVLCFKCRKKNRDYAKNKK
jgi:hypothetical protein